MAKIPWTNETWNPVVGCTKIAAGCKNCYAERMAKRLYHMGNANLSKFPEYMNFEDGWKNGHVELCEHRLEEPLRWKKGRMIFVCSMGDLFHEKVPTMFIQQIFAVMENCKRHIFQILTKRPENMLRFVKDWKEKIDYMTDLPSPSQGLYLKNYSHVWLGTSISTQADADKNIPILLQIPAAVRFVSIEPMLERINRWQIPAGNVPGFAQTKLCDHLHWVIIGCESGPGARLCSLDDIDYVIDQCRAANVPIFLKQIPLNGKYVKDPAKWPEKYQAEDLRQYPKENQKSKCKMQN